MRISVRFLFMSAVVYTARHRRWIQSEKRAMPENAFGNLCWSDKSKRNTLKPRDYNGGLEIAMRKCIVQCAHDRIIIVPCGVSEDEFTTTIGRAYTIV